MMMIVVMLTAPTTHSTFNRDRQRFLGGKSASVVIARALGHFQFLRALDKNISDHRQREGDAATIIARSLRQNSDGRQVGRELAEKQDGAAAVIVRVMATNRARRILQRNLSTSYDSFGRITSRLSGDTLIS